MHRGLALAVVCLVAACVPETMREPIDEPADTADAGVVAEPDSGGTGEADADVTGEPDSGGTGEGDATTGEADATVEVDAGTQGASWEDVRAIFQTNCRRCHDGVGRAWDATDPADLVGVASSELPALKRIEPGEPDMSFVFRKISGTQSAACTEQGSSTRNCGARMPPQAAMLSATNIEIIKLWIEAGAVVE